MKVEAVKLPTEITIESLQQYIADCSSVVRNKEPKDAARLWDRLMKESYGDRPSRMFEYIPCTIWAYQASEWVKLGNPRQLFGFFPENDMYQTNARELLSWGWTWDEILPTVDFTHYRTVKIIAPYFIYGQLSTHTQITSVSHSARYTDADMGYWYPPEFKTYHDALSTSKSFRNKIQQDWDYAVQHTAPVDFESFMKSLGINRREVFARGSDMLQYRVYCLGGYMNNPNAFPHFIDQRMKDLHTQLESRQVTEMIAKEIGYE